MNKVVYSLNLRGIPALHIQASPIPKTFSHNINVKYSSFKLLILSTVCSTTLWIGQLDKRATQQDVANLLEEFGQIESLNVSICYP